MTLNCSTFTPSIIIMSIMVPYSQALNFAACCELADEFLNEYGSAIRWTDCKIDFNELFAFVESKLDQR